jgi:hypothetical protein
MTTENMDLTAETVDETTQTQDDTAATPEPGGEEGSLEAADETVSEPVYEIEGQKLTAKQIKEALEDSRNKAEWQKKLTMSSQELSEQKKLYGDIEMKSKVLERAQKIHDLISEHPELARRFTDAEARYYEELENDPSMQEKIRTTKLEQEIDSLKKTLNDMRVNERKIMMTADMIKLKEREGLTDEEANQVLEETVRRGHPSLEGAMYTLFKDKLVQKIRQETEKKVMEEIKKKGLRVQPKVGGVTGATASKGNHRKPDVEEYLAQGKTVDDWIKAITE